MRRREFIAGLGTAAVRSGPFSRCDKFAHAELTRLEPRSSGSSQPLGGGTVAVTPSRGAGGHRTWAGNPHQRTRLAVGASGSDGPGAAY
jgi:hypothetical protein